MAVSPLRSAQTADIDKAAVSKLIRRNSFYSQRGIVTLAGFLIDGEVCGSVSSAHPQHVEEDAVVVEFDVEE